MVIIDRFGYSEISYKIDIKTCQCLRAKIWGGKKKNKYVSLADRAQEDLVCFGNTVRPLSIISQRTARREQ